MKRPVKRSTLPDTRILCACTNLKMTARVVGRAYDDALAAAGLNVTQYAILVNVDRHQPISLMKLADLLGLERTSLYRAVALLEKNGWLRATDLGEGVTRVVALTDAGDKLLEKARPLWEKTQNAFVRQFGRERWDEFLGTLAEIRGHFAT
jgi:DNA-binding MarR family transcriptional regulator